MSNPTIKQIKPSKQQKTVVIKVIIAMTLFLLGIPFLMFLTTGYFTKKGLVMDVYLMGQEYADQVNQFHTTKGTCPTDQDIKSIITESDVAEKISFISGTKSTICIIELSLKPLGETFDNNWLRLSKTFEQKSSTSTDWQCYSNIASRYLPKNCIATKL